MPSIRTKGIKPSLKTEAPTFGRAYESMVAERDDPTLQLGAWEPPKDLSIVPGSSFINYGTLLGMNAGASREMAQRLLGQGQALGRDAKAALGASERKFAEGLEGAREGLRPVGRSSYASGRPDGLATGSASMQEDVAPLDPTAVTREQAQTYAAQHYAGPRGLNNEEDILAKAARATDYAQAAGKGPAGLGSLLTGNSAPSAASLLSGSLAGTASDGAFDELNKRYGGLLGDATKRIEAAKQTAQDLDEEADINAGEWRAFLDRYPADKPSRMTSDGSTNMENVERVGGVALDYPQPRSDPNNAMQRYFNGPEFESAWGGLTPADKLAFVKAIEAGDMDTAWALYNRGFAARASESAYRAINNAMAAYGAVAPYASGFPITLGPQGGVPAPG